MEPLVIWQTLARACAKHGDDVGVVDGDERFTYRQVAERAGALASFFAEQGVVAGDRIAILEVNSHVYLEAYYAAAGLGAILCPVNHRLSPAEVSSVIADAGARWLIASESFAATVHAVLAVGSRLAGVVWIGGELPVPGRAATHELEQAIAGREGAAFVPVSVEPDQVAQLYYTSGTTGRPKGVMLTHRNVCVHAGWAIEELGLAASDVWAHVAPMFHLADAWAGFAITAVGGTHVMLPRFDAGAVLATIEERQVTISNLIPTMLNLMTKHRRLADHDYSSLRVLLSGGAPIAPEVVRATMGAFGCDYIQTYGMTETSPFLTMSILSDQQRELPAERQLELKAKTGRPFGEVELKVVDDAGVPVAPDGQQVGEIWARGATITPGYWNRPAETAAAFVDGWLRTGDLAVLDTEGFVNIVDRKKDMIITGGENVYSTEVENVLYTHPQVLEAAVYGVPDERWGEAVFAAVVLKPGEQCDAAAIIAYCRARLAGYKTPKGVEFLAELPRTGSGKIFKQALREAHQQGRTDGS